MKGEMKEAKMHYDALLEVLAGLGMSLADFEEQMSGGEMEEPEGYEEEEGEESEEEEGEEMPKPMDKGKVAIIVARMRKGQKG